MCTYIYLRQQSKNRSQSKADHNAVRSIAKAAYDEILARSIHLLLPTSKFTLEPRTAQATIVRGSFNPITHHCQRGDSS
jgi:hypothetical protein